MYHRSFTFCAYVDGKRVNLNIHGKSLSFMDVILHFDLDIKAIAFGKDKFFVLLMDFKSDGNYDLGTNQRIYGDVLANDSVKHQLANNISAFDYSGKYLYNIGDIAPKSKIYCDFSIYRNDGVDFYPDKSIVGNEYLTCFDVYGTQNMVIDITNDTFFISEDPR